MAAITATE